jgi:organic hydroperoxide reductase OsmC/OhrA
MKISAHIANQQGQHTVTVRTGDASRPLYIPHKAEGSGSSVNGGELLFLALATCYCNDLYREARKRGIEIEKVQVEVTGDFGAEGEGARNVEYSALVNAKAPQAAILDLMRHTDTVAEIQNTLRSASIVVLSECQAHEV